MITISLTVPDKLAARLLPLQDRLTEIIELGLRQVEAKADDASEASQSKLQVLAALSSTGIVTLPRLVIPSQARLRRTPIQAGGQLASEIIIQERGPL